MEVAFCANLRSQAQSGPSACEVSRFVLRVLTMRGYNELWCML